jgi:hypothetical protein
MFGTFTVSDAERRLLLELLQAERQELVPEIHHTDDRGFRDELRERQHMIEQLIERIEGAVVQ